MSPLNPEKIATIMQEVAEARILPRFQQLSEGEIATKSGPSDLVTIADIEAEEDLTRILKDILPGSLVIGEEAVSKEEISMGLLATESDPIWVVDPVDGTNNFASGNEKFGMIIALVQKGEVRQGWLYDIPQTRFAIAEQGSGVYIGDNRKNFPKINSRLSEARGFISRKFLPKPLKEKVKPVLAEHFGDVETYMCCCHEYLDILEGESFYALYSRIKPWDHLSGAMMMTEAGGFVRKWDGSLYKPGDEKGGLICAEDEQVWQEIHGLLLPDVIPNKA